MENEDKGFTVEPEKRELQIIQEVMRFPLDYRPVEGICPELNIATQDIETLTTWLKAELNSG